MLFTWVNSACCESANSEWSGNPSSSSLHLATLVHRKIQWRCISQSETSVRCRDKTILFTSEKPRYTTVFTLHQTPGGNFRKFWIIKFQQHWNINFVYLLLYLWVCLFVYFGNWNIWCTLSLYSVVQIRSDRFGEICKLRSRVSLALLSLGGGIDQWQTS